ncbi:MAG: hypothetical protein HY094_04590 [Candidatus Melainabacteria bacterium]|nr:hypothetical protein [Candidatus Melainabacteria bacterium]
MSKIRKNFSISDQSAKYLKSVDNESDFVDKLIKQAMFENAASSMAKDPDYLKEFKDWDSLLKDGLEND